MTEENIIKISKKKLWRYSTFVLVGVLMIMVLFNGDRNITGNVVAVGGAGEIVEVKTVIQGFQYQPDVVTVKEGSLVRLTIENKDNVLHGLHLPQFGLVESTPPLATKTFEFKAIETPTNGRAVPTCSREHGETLTFNIV